MRPERESRPFLLIISFCISVQLDSLYHLLSKKRLHSIKIISRSFNPDGSAVSGYCAQRAYSSIRSSDNEKPLQSKKLSVVSSLNLFSHVNFLHSSQVILPSLPSSQWQRFLHLIVPLFIDHKYKMCLCPHPIFSNYGHSLSLQRCFVSPVLDGTEQKPLSLFLPLIWTCVVEINIYSTYSRNWNNIVCWQKGKGQFRCCFLSYHCDHHGGGGVLYINGHLGLIICASPCTTIYTLFICCSK